MRKKLLLAAVLDQSTVKQFCHLLGSEMFDIRGSTEPDVEEFRAAIGKADAIWTSLRLPLTANLLNHASRLAVQETVALPVKAPFHFPRALILICRALRGGRPLYG